MPYSPPTHNAFKVDRKKQQIEYNKRKRTGQEFYNGGRWVKVRTWFKKRHPICIECEKLGKIKSGDVVDHIVPVKQGGEKYNADNLQTLCHLHHNQKTAAEDKG